MSDRRVGADGEKIRFASAMHPLWARRAKSLDALLPVLCLRRFSTGDFREVLTALLGKDAPILSPSVIPSPGTASAALREKILAAKGEL
jgi:putative transposase